jgi:hypothetical protein
LSWHLFVHCGLYVPSIQRIDDDYQFSRDQENRLGEPGAFGMVVPGTEIATGKPFAIKVRDVQSCASLLFCVFSPS